MRNVRMTDPISYLDMLMLQKGAKVVLTDSGGVQKEAFWLQVPCITLREETEWLETVESGLNVLVGVDPSLIVEKALNMRLPPTKRGKSTNTFASDRIVRTIEETSEPRRPS